MGGPSPSSGIVRTITLSDDRILSYAIYGDQNPGAPVLFYFHSFPDSHHTAVLFEADALKHGLCIIAPDRPGIGLSTFQRLRAITEWPSDIIQLADSLCIQTFGVFGGGGATPYVLACCAKLPSDRLKVAGVSSGVYPSSLSSSGLPLEARIFRWVAPWIPDSVHQRVYERWVSAAHDTGNPERLEAMLDTHIKTRYRESTAWDNNTGGYRDVWVASVRAVFQGNGSAAVAQDVRLVMGDWRFSLKDVNMDKGRLVLWHDNWDPKNPFSLAERASGMMLGSELRLRERGEKGEGDDFLLLVDETLATLGERLQW